MSGDAPSFFQVHLASIASVLFMLALVGLFYFGVWSRSFLYPANITIPLRRQLVAAVPVGLITMAVYAKTVLPGITSGDDDATDYALIAGYAIIYGMLSRETLDRMLANAKPPVEIAPGTETTVSDPH